MRKGEERGGAQKYVVVTLTFYLLSKSSASHPGREVYYNSRLSGPLQPTKTL
jgi:hypothetical protein